MQSIANLYLHKKFKYSYQTVFEKLVNFALESLDALNMSVTF